MQIFSLKNKIAVITGSAGGIGKAIVEGFNQAGAIVHGLDIKEGFDITNIDNINDYLITECPTIDVLVNCAGVTFQDKIERYSEKDWNKTLEVNLTAPFKLCQIVFPYMKNKGGSIINITSIWANRPRSHDNPAYGVSKGGLKTLTQCLAWDWAKYKIRVNAIGPGLIKTNMIKKTWGNKKRYEKAISRIPLGRIGDPEEVANTAIFLASDASSYITGIDLYVDGGWLIKGD